MKQIVKSIRELEDLLVVCMRCGMCQSVCPLYNKTGRESDVARGKLALLDGLMNEIFENPDSVNERLNKCLLCGSCAANCPSGVDALAIFMKARSILTAYTGLSHAKRLVLRGMLSHPQLFDKLTEWGAKFQKIATTPVNEVIGTSCARFTPPILENRHLVNLAQTPFHRKIPQMDVPPGNSGIRVSLFTGCLIDKVFPNIAEASVNVLLANKNGIFIPKNQACCGIPAVSSGDMETFNKLLSLNLAAFAEAKFDYLLTACATCTSTIKKVWPRMADDRLKAKVEKLSSKVMDINRFIVEKTPMVDSGKTNLEKVKKVTYHDPCHLKKSLGVFNEPRELIRKNPAYALTEMNASDWCCGMGGSFNLQYYQLSQAIGKDKRDSIKQTGATHLATGCPACMIQISDALSQAGDKIKIVHPVEIYAEMF